jgi:hypothetical protein
LAALRVAAAVALGTPVAQELVDGKRMVREGQLLVRAGILGTKRAVVSAPLTPASIDWFLVDQDGGGVPPSRLAPALELIRDSLRVFDAARYKRDGALDSTALDVALDNGAREIRRLRYANVWWVRRATQNSRTVAREGGV